MWRGLTTASSRKIVASPKADSASRMHASSASRRSSGRSTRRMPRPPPPATALAKTGKPISSAATTRASTLVLGSALRRVGSPASLAAAMARALLPVRCSTLAGGPTKVMP